MSYKKRKLRKSTLSQLKYRAGLAKIALLRLFKRSKGDKKMRLPQTRNIMQWLRDRSRVVRPNNLKINGWVDDYINQCIIEGKPIEIITQWCVSKNLEVRYKQQENSFVPTKRERMLFEKRLPEIANVFRESGAAFNWWMTFNRSYLDSGRIDPALESSYIKMIGQLAEPLVQQGWLMLNDWENDIIGRRSEPDSKVLASVERFVESGALRLEVQRHSSWALEEAGLNQSDQELKKDVYFQIACEAEEGQLLGGVRSPFGEFIMIPLEAAERYDFFTLCVPDFKKRIVAVLPLTPWRL